MRQTYQQLADRRRSTSPHREKPPPKRERQRAAVRHAVSILDWWDRFNMTKPGSVEAERMLALRTIGGTT